MRSRYVGIALATLLVLTFALPAVGDVLDVYRIGWSTSGEAYASVEGACGRVEPPMPAGDYRQIVFCFGDTVDVRWESHSGRAERVGLWIRDHSCVAGECTGASWVLMRPAVTYSVDPLLVQATVQASVPDCGPVSLIVTGESEPNLKTTSSGGSHDIGTHSTGGRVLVVMGGSAGSVGRDGSVSGTLCDVTNADGFGRVFRGLGSEGAAAEIFYESG